MIPSFTKRPTKPQEIGGGDGDAARGRGGGSGRGGSSGRGRGSGPGRPRGRGRGVGQLPIKVLTPGSYLSQVCKYVIVIVYLFSPCHRLLDTSLVRYKFSRWSYFLLFYNFCIGYLYRMIKINRKENN